MQYLYATAVIHRNKNKIILKYIYISTHFAHIQIPYKYDIELEIIANDGPSSSSPNPQTFDQ